MSIETITPAMAEAYLTHLHSRQRPRSQPHVRKLASLMAAGRWELNGGTIAFAADGALLDGQHRLHAIVLAQTTITTFVVRGVDPQAIDTTDTGKPRYTSDVLAMDGFPRHVGAAAVANAMASLDVMREHGFIQDRRTERDEMIAYARRHRAIVDQASLYYVSARKSGLTPLTSLGGTYGWLLKEIRSTHHNDLDLFFVDQVAKGLNLTTGSPALALRTTMAAGQRGSSRPSQLKDNVSGTGAMLIACTRILLAWNAFIRGNALTRSQTPPIAANGLPKFPDVWVSPTQRLKR